MHLPVRGPASVKLIKTAINVKKVRKIFQIYFLCAFPTCNFAMNTFATLTVTSIITEYQLHILMTFSLDRLLLSHSLQYVQFDYDLSELQKRGLNRKFMRVRT